MKWANEALLRLSVLLGAVLLFATAHVRAQGNPSPPSGEHTQQFNLRLEESRNSLSRTLSEPTVVDESRIGPDDLLEITVFEAPELNRSLRVSANGEISLQLLGPVKAGGLTPRQLESVLQELLRRTYMKDLHVGVFVRELQSHPVSVVGAVKKPGVFQIRGTKTVLELLSMAEGLADDAGDTVLVMRGASFSGTGGRDNAQPEKKETQQSPWRPATRHFQADPPVSPNKKAQAKSWRSTLKACSNLLIPLSTFPFIPVTL
jgi:protein involved in polysaccharide export with SLBB domain